MLSHFFSCIRADGQNVSIPPIPFQPSDHMAVHFHASNIFPNNSRSSAWDHWFFLSFSKLVIHGKKWSRRKECILNALCLELYIRTIQFRLWDTYFDCFVGKSISLLDLGKTMGFKQIFQNSKSVWKKCKKRVSLSFNWKLNVLSCVF